MKYIHVPTGVLYDQIHLTNLDINDFVRANLPRHWRVEGFYASCEWAEQHQEANTDILNSKLTLHNSIIFEGVERISMAEFMYHIYNPWKAEKKEPHYNHQPIEVIDMMLSIYGKEAVIYFCLLNSFKYRMRAGHKDDAVRDIEKALWYEKKAKELEIK
jgi:hypothetical protein